MSIYSKAITGGDYVDLIERFIAVLNSDKGTLRYQDAWASVCARQCEKAVLEVCNMFQATLAKIQVPCMNNADLQQKYIAAKNEATT